MPPSRRRLGLAAVLLAALAVLTALSASTTAAAPNGGVSAAASTLPGFRKVVFLSHVNDPATTPGFPGDPAFTLETAFTVPADGFYLQKVTEGEHTGTHWAAPCHFHTDERCADQLDPADMVRPAVVVDVRAEVRRDVDYQVTIGDLKAWEARYGRMPAGAAVIAWTGCDRFWSASQTGRNYYNCGSGLPGLHQPGFSLAAVRWLIDRGVLGRRGALGTDTFGPDPSSDEQFRESSLVLHRHRIDLENLTGLGQLPPRGAWVVAGGPRNRDGSGSPATVFGLVP
ncbi:MAG TPA: cyclase family protein [Actinomycetota bacterium]|nr:cyclase family protein [Actinomycetota bacterium]